MKKEERRKDVVFILYILTVLILAVIYFSVPERTLFLENQIKWWREFREMIKTFIQT
ncbi:hypothetical protein BMS3Abin10_01743 [bacterium BMS3Abin10]|nr:hypothetical protein BMS3Abin10_01743 [bacterium BMS3Abin10]GBE39112.1 hypothetical protein BMS3Bbin08_01730 [bacterium BMS3Bbin08]